jgi:hypothetical protein
MDVCFVTFKLKSISNICLNYSDGDATMKHVLRRRSVANNEGNESIESPTSSHIKIVPLFYLKKMYQGQKVHLFRPCLSFLAEAQPRVENGRGQNAFFGRGAH